MGGCKTIFIFLLMAKACTFLFFASSSPYSPRMLKVSSLAYNQSHHLLARLEWSIAAVHEQPPCVNSEGIVCNPSDHSHTWLEIRRRSGFSSKSTNRASGRSKTSLCARKPKVPICCLRAQGAPGGVPCLLLSWRISCSLSSLTWSSRACE